jgi:hypothetical protein
VKGQDSTMAPRAIRPPGAFADPLRTIARIVAGCRAALEAEESKSARPSEARPRNARQITIGQIMLLVALWAVTAAVWHRNWKW